MSLCLVRTKGLAAVAAGAPGAGIPTLQGTGYLELALDPVTNRTGDVWHVCVEVGGGCGGVDDEANEK